MCDGSVSNAILTSDREQELRDWLAELYRVEAQRRDNLRAIQGTIREVEDILAGLRGDVDRGYEDGA